MESLIHEVTQDRRKIKTKHNKETLSFEAFSFTLFGLQSIPSACGAT